MRALLALALLASGCDKRTDEPAAAAPPPRPQLPGAIWLVDHGKLVRIERDARLVVESDVPLFPSRFALPDGRLVAIASRGDGSAESEQLALVARDGKVTRLGPRAAMVRDPAVDRAGTWIAIAANLDGHSDLYRIELATEQVKRLTDNREGNFTPAVLGDDLVFASSRDGDSEIYRLSGARLTAFHKDDFAPVPSPDGKTIVFQSDRETWIRLFAIAPDGTNLRRLTARSEPGDELEPLWSPDGTRLAYLHQHGKQRTLYLRDLAAGTERALATGAVTELSFSPDGAWLAFAREQASGDAVLAIRLADGHTVEVGAGRLPRWQ